MIKLQVPLLNQSRRRHRRRLKIGSTLHGKDTTEIDNNSLIFLALFVALSFITPKQLVSSSSSCYLSVAFLPLTIRSQKRLPRLRRQFKLYDTTTTSTSKNDNDNDWHHGTKFIEQQDVEAAVIRTVPEETNNDIRNEHDDIDMLIFENNKKLKDGVVDEALANPSLQIVIRDCKYNELGFVSELIMKSFYDTSTSTTTSNNINSSSSSNNNNNGLLTGGGIWNQFYKLGELNRIQRGYPYGDDKALHRMMIATTARTSKSSRLSQTTKNNTSYNSNNNNHTNTKFHFVHNSNTIVDDDPNSIVIGYVDIDFRPTNVYGNTFRYNPRPYLSDLCIDPLYRRYGIGKELVQTCEEYVRTVPNHILERANQQLQSLQTSAKNICHPNVTKINNNELYIRVQRTNIAALSMYQKLNYQIIYNPDDPHGTTDVLILYKKLFPPINQ